MDRTTQTLDVDELTEEELRDVLGSLKLGKASGNDLISHQMLKNTADSVCVPLTYIFNCSLRQSIYPNSWKIANVFAFYKKGDKSLVSNYRPIALLSCVGKVFERVISKYIYNYILDNRLLYKFQSGFVPGHSTYHQLIELYHKVCLAFESGDISCIIFCDISKAFDRIWHKGLIVKLKSYCIDGRLLKWLKSYLSNRQQKVVINNSESTVGILKAGVPQGSVLGPLLFLLHINDIADDIECLVRLFADDSSLMYSSENKIEIEGRLNTDLVALDHWAKQWLINFNPQKTEFVIFSLRKDDSSLDLRFNDQPIPMVENHKHLGVTFSSDCKWTAHIDNICRSASKQIYILRKLKYILSRQHLNRIYLTFILPLFEYACELWDGCTDRNAEKLERLQLEAARIITGLPRFASKESLFFETGWVSLKSRRNQRKLSLMHKIHNGKSPEYLTECLSEYSNNVDNYNLRNRPQYRIPRCRLETFNRSFFPSSIRAWNSLSAETRSTQSQLGFKNKLKTEYLPVPKYYFIGDRFSNITHTKIRHRCSSLNADLYRVNLVNKPNCSCGCPLEDAFHYFLECPLYINFRVALLRNIQPLIIPSVENILFGNELLTDDQNAFIFRSLHHYIKQTKRFS